MDKNDREEKRIRPEGRREGVKWKAGKEGRGEEGRKGRLRNERRGKKVRG